MEIFLGNHVFLPYGANWKTRPKASLGSMTNSRETPVGGEVRATAWATLRRTQDWTVTGRDGEECGRIEETVRVALAARCAGAPYWLASRAIAAVNGNVITLDAAPDLPLAQGTILWFGGLGAAAYGLCTVASASGRSVTLVAAPAGIAAGMQCAPVLLGTLDSDPDVSEIHGAARSWTLRLTESGDLHGLTRSGAEAMGLGLSIAAVRNGTILGRNANEFQVLALTISATRTTIVVGQATAEAMAMAISIAATRDEIAINQTHAETAGLNLTISAERN
jgi:hypothetical protein